MKAAFATHFDENAKILIRGYIDYIMTAKTRRRTWITDALSTDVRKH